MSDAPKKLGKYDILSEIGRGSMGIVYRAFDPYINREVAVKVAMAEALKDKDTGERFRKMFFNEAHTAGMLRHPNILDIFDAGVDGDSCYIVMELVAKGGTLRPYCRAEKLLPLNQAAEIIFKCAKALDYAHRQGVIHRDIKPSNILVTDDMDVKIADFSIAHAVRQDTTQTMPLGFVGSPRYMSPEQVHEDVITNQTDLFSLGVVAYELITGHHPFGGESFSALVHKIVNEDPPPMSNYRADTPEVLERIVRRALEKNPARRYRTGLDIAADLSMVFTHLERPQEDIAITAKFDKVKRLEFFRGFPDNEIWEIIRASVWMEVDVDTAVVIEGEVDEAFFIIVSGDVSVTKFGQSLDQLHTGDCFGEMGYLNRIKRTATVKADGPLSLLKINATLIEQVSADCQLRFYKVFMKVLIDRLARTSEMAVRGPAL
ncbi:MAG: protein kinase [Proteobacteria bacterium]|jgi:serine/threonine protein kinase|nr:protein kinase [Pseudomonadota bacterium]